MKKLNLNTALSVQLIGLCASLIISAVSCSVPERDHEFETASSKYRKDDIKPQLPNLKPDSSLSDYLTYAVLNNLGIEEAYYDWKSSIEEVTVAASLPQPKLSLEWMIQSGVNAFFVGLMQETPWSGKLDLRAEAYSAVARQKRFIFEQKILNTIADVKSLAHELQYITTRLDLSREILNLIKTKKKIILESIASGLPQAKNDNLIDIQIEEDHMLNEITNLEDSLNPLKENWRKALGLTQEQQNTPIPKIKSEEFSLKEDHDLIKEALVHNKQIKSIEQEIAQADAMLRLAYKENYPDATIWAKTDIRPNRPILNPEIGLTLPIWRDKIAAQISAASAMRDKTKSALIAEQINLAVIVAEKSFMWREQNRFTQLITTHHIPLTETKISNLTSLISVGKANIADLIDKQIELVNYKIDLAQFILGREISSIELTHTILGKWPQEIENIFTK
ncbi:MAG: TolC family protein [Planctomycetes bacterium]|nr:TolC family protein [Planctomycetota bacterium]